MSTRIALDSGADKADRLALSAGFIATREAKDTWSDAQPRDKTPAALRRRLTGGVVEAAGSALARFVGIEAYEAAGGVVRRDLFDHGAVPFPVVGATGPASSGTGGPGCRSR